MTEDRDPTAAEGAEVSERLAGVANGLSELFGPVTAASFLVSTAVTTVRHRRGRRAAVEFMQLLTATLEQEFGPGCDGRPGGLH